MNWEAIGVIAEVFGVIAVFLSLIYVAVQIRDNTKSQQAATYHAMTSAKNQVNLEMASNAEVALILLNGSQDYQNLELKDRHRFNLIMRSIFGVCEDIYVQFAKGLVDIEDHEINVAMIRDLLKQNGISNWLSKNRHLFRKAFIEEVTRTQKM